MCTGCDSKTVEHCEWVRCLHWREGDAGLECTEGDGCVERRSQRLGWENVIWF